MRCDRRAIASSASPASAIAACGPRSAPAAPSRASAAASTSAARACTLRRAQAALCSSPPRHGARAAPRPPWPVWRSRCGAFGGFASHVRSAIFFVVTVMVVAVGLRRLWPGAARMPSQTRIARSDRRDRPAVGRWCARRAWPGAGLRRCPGVAGNRCGRRRRGLRTPTARGRRARSAARRRSRLRRAPSRTRRL